MLSKIFLISNNNLDRMFRFSYLTQYFLFIYFLFIYMFIIRYLQEIIIVLKWLEWLIKVSDAKIRGRTMFIKSDRINCVSSGDAIGFIQASESEDWSHDRFRGRRGWQFGETGAATAGRGCGRSRERVWERWKDRTKG